MSHPAFLRSAMLSPPTKHSIPRISNRPTRSARRLTACHSPPPPPSRPPTTSTTPSTTATTPASALSQLIPRALLLFIAALWGTNFPIIKLIQTGASPLTPSIAAYVRFTLASITLLPPTLYELQTHTKRLPPSFLPLSILAGISIFLGNLSQAISLQHTSATTTAFVCSLSVVLVPLITPLLPSSLSPPSTSTNPLLPALLAMCGVAILELSPSSLSTLSAQDIWAFLQPICFALAFILNESAIKSAPRLPITLSAVQLAACALLSDIWAIFFTFTTSTSLPSFSSLMHSAAPNQLLALAYTGVVTTGCAVWLQNVALKDVSAAEMALLFSTIPLWAAAFSALALAEHVGVSVALGGTLIVAACVVGRGQGGE